MCPLFIFIPGTDGTGQLLRSQLETLETIFDIRCVAIPADDVTHWDGLVSHLERLVRIERQSSVPRPVYICGESFGGCLALKLLAAAPDLCDRLILINPASSFRRQTWMHWVAQAIHWLPLPVYTLATVGLLPLLIVRDRVSRENQQALLEAMQSVTPNSAAWRLSLLSSFALDDMPLHRITQPVLIIAAAADHLLPSYAEADELVRRLPNARSIILPQSGHACLLETEIQLDEILKAQNFLDQERYAACAQIQQPQKSFQR